MERSFATNCNKNENTDEYSVERISNNKIRYKYYPKRIKTEFVGEDRCDLFVPHYNDIDKKVYNEFVKEIRKHTQQNIIIKLDQWIYLTINNNI